MDTVLKITEGVRLYLYSAIDIRLKFSLSLPYLKLNSFHTLDFFRKLELVYPGEIKSVQTDNGLEFLGIFHQYLLKRQIPHYFIYPDARGSMGWLKDTMRKEECRKSL